MTIRDDTNLLERVAVDLDIRLNQLGHLEWEPTCQGETHNRGLHGHNPEQPAAYYVIAPCHGPRIMICNSRANYLRTRGLLKCSICKIETLIERWRFEPIRRT